MPTYKGKGTCVRLLKNGREVIEDCDAGKRVAVKNNNTLKFRFDKSNNLIPIKAKDNN